jgi:hypothetical protein
MGTGRIVFGGVVFAGVLAIAAAGCNGVLDIEQASVDPTFGTDGGNGVDSGINFDPTDISCDHYCTLIQSACTGDLQEYLTKDVCMHMCPVFDLGNPGEQSNNSLSCRQYHANAARSAPQIHCHHAGPLGGQVCGTDPCAAFCLLDQGVCGTVAYASVADCTATCAGMVDGGADAEAPMGYQFVPDAGETTVENGDSFNCRLYHLEAASDPAIMMATTIHCPHTGRQSDVCHN